MLKVEFQNRKPLQQVFVQTRPPFLLSPPVPVIPSARVTNVVVVVAQVALVLVVVVALVVALVLAIL